MHNGLTHLWYPSHKSCIRRIDRIKPKCSQNISGAHLTAVVVSGYTVRRVMVEVAVNAGD